MKNFINLSPPGTGTRGNAWQAILLGALLAVSAGAQAAGTAAGTVVNNIARLSYDVGGTSQGDICSSDTGNGTADTNGTCADNTGKTTFTVDNKVDVLVTESSGTATTVVAGQASAVTTFTVKNEGNKTQDFALFTANLVSGSRTVSGVTGSPFTDNFEATGCTIALLGTTGSATFSSTGGAHLDALVADEVATVTVTCAIPAAQANGSAAVIYLGATARTNDSAATLGGALAQSGSNAEDTEDIVFADDAGSDDATIVGSGTGVRDATHSARDVYVVATAQLSVAKTLTTICDPVNGSSTPFNIPGAAVQYAITITNASGAGAAATLAQITDVLDTTNLTFDAGLISGTGAAANCVAGTGNLSASGFGAVRGTGTTTTTYAAPGLAANATTAGATQAAGMVTIDFATLATSAIIVPAAATLPANSYITIYFNTFVK